VPRPDAGAGRRYRDLSDDPVPGEGHGDKDKGGMIRLFEDPPGVHHRGTPAG
jgi:hypothetical protein